MTRPFFFIDSVITNHIDFCTLKHCAFHAPGEDEFCIFSPECGYDDFNGCSHCNYWTLFTFKHILCRKGCSRDYNEVLRSLYKDIENGKHALYENPVISQDVEDLSEAPTQEQPLSPDEPEQTEKEIERDLEEEFDEKVDYEAQNARLKRRLDEVENEFAAYKQHKKAKYNELSLKYNVTRDNLIEAIEQKQLYERDEEEFRKVGEELYDVKIENGHLKERNKLLLEAHNGFRTKKYIGPVKETLTLINNLKKALASLPKELLYVVPFPKID